MEDRWKPEISAVLEQAYGRHGGENHKKMRFLKIKDKYIKRKGEIENTFYIHLVFLKKLLLQIQ